MHSLLATSVQYIAILYNSPAKNSNNTKLFLFYHMFITEVS